MTGSSVRRPARAGLMLLAVILLLGCNDGTSPEVDALLTGRVGQRVWRGEATVAVEPQTGGGHVLQLSALSPVGNGTAPFEIITIRVPFAGPGRYDLTGNQVSVTILLGGDVLTGTYAGSESDAGVLVISEFGSTPGDIVAGTLTFDAELESGETEYGPRFSFRDGQFRAVLFSPIASDASHARPFASGDLHDVPQH